MNGFAADSEVLRTRVDYGSPGGYLLTVTREEDAHSDEVGAFVYVDDTLVARCSGCDYTTAEFTIARADLVDRHGIDVEKVIQYALGAFGGLYLAAVGS